MAEKKKKAPTLNSPRGVFKFPKVTKPDFGTKDYPKPDGEYNIRLILQHDAPATKSFIAKLEPMHAAAVEEGKAAAAALKVESRKKLEKTNGKDLVSVNDLYTVLYDQETEEPTGEIEFKFKMKAGGERKDGTKWSQKPGVFDAHLKKLPKGVDVWGGSEGKISFYPDPYFIPGTGAVGLGLKLSAVQVLELVSAGERSGASYGFSEEDGFDADSIETEDSDDANAPTGTDDDAGADENNGDF